MKKYLDRGAEAIAPHTQQSAELESAAEGAARNAKIYGYALLWLLASCRDSHVLPFRQYSYFPKKCISERVIYL